jgi:hypothetical protein
MLNQTRAALATQEEAEDLSLGDRDRNVLRGLAARVAELAAVSIQNEKRQLWYAINALQSVRPIVLCDPENGWNEIVTENQMKCKSRLGRQWEMALRKEIFWGEQMGDDRVIEPYFTVSYCVDREPDWGVREVRKSGGPGGSYVWDAPIKTYDDLGKLRFPMVSVNRESTARMVALADEVFAGLLRVELKGLWWWTLGMTWTCISLRGLEQMMLDMCLEPEGLKRLMSFLRDGTLAQLDYLENHGLLSLNNDRSYVGSGGFGYTTELPQRDFDGRVRTGDMWGFAESQETTQVSPDHFEEFVFPYQLPILDRFGLNCYGCCEPLHLRWHVVKKFPRLRRISVSPWADPEKMAEYLSNNYIFSMKPNPAALAVPALDEDWVRKGLRQALDITRGCCVEVIMKDNHTIGRNPENVIRWCRIAREEADSV